MRIRINSTPLLCIVPYKRVTTCTGGSSCMGSVQEVLHIPRRPLVFFTKFNPGHFSLRIPHFRSLGYSYEYPDLDPRYDDYSSPAK